MAQLLADIFQLADAPGHPVSELGNRLLQYLRVSLLILPLGCSKCLIPPNSWWSEMSSYVWCFLGSIRQPLLKSYFLEGRQKDQMPTGMRGRTGDHRSFPDVSFTKLCHFVALKLKPQFLHLCKYLKNLISKFNGFHISQLKQFELTPENLTFCNLSYFKTS